MGTIIFEGQVPFEIAPQSQTTVTAEGGNVVLTLVVFAHGTAVPIRLVLTPDQAGYTLRKFAPMVTKARAQARHLG
jgi:hypothetical protein